MINVTANKEKQRAEIIENSNDCEYDIDACECLAIGCQRYGLCPFTQ